ncbi:MAG: DUF308 domain-containing protein [Prevotellaceae bacterium]|jgi:uncharacterized membrane protein HdeD (DUF308 family)|nr:DUF308 domain-containing protein [Prevotellaceae bacterium]
MKNSASRKILLIIIGVVLAAAGVIALLEPQGATALLVYLFGLAVLLSGIGTAITAFLPSFADSRRSLIVLAAASILLGVLIMIIKNVFILLLGIGVMLAGVSLAIVSLQWKKQGLSWFGSMCAAIATIVVGIVLTLFFSQIQAAIGVILGVGLLAVGIILVVVGIAMPKQPKELKA